jgi:ribosome-associated protein
MGEQMIEVTDDLSIPEGEIEYIFSRSSKPGGQNVNKVSTRVTLLFDVGASPSISEDQRRRIGKRLKTRITKDGVLRVVSQKHRLQHANREAALARFIELVREALVKKRKRKRTRVPLEIREHRLREKKRRGRLKSMRSRVSPEEQ